MLRRVFFLLSLSPRGSAVGPGSAARLHHASTRVTARGTVTVRAISGNHCMHHALTFVIQMSRRLWSLQSPWLHCKLM